MPTYEYECGKCGHSFDAFQRMSEDPLKECPHCGEASLKRLVGGGIGVIFKGSGFYATDSRSGNGKGPGGSAASGGDGAESTASSATPESGTTESTKKESGTTDSTPTKNGSGSDKKSA